MTDLTMTDLTPLLLAFFLGVVVAIGVGTIAEKIMNDASGNTQEQYGYDAGGARVKKTSGATTTYTFFAH